MYINVKKTHESGVHYLVIVDIRTDRAYGEHAENFMGYIALQGRGKVSILIDSWHKVDDELKEAKWDDVKDVFLISPEDSIVKKKLLTYCGERWRGFKTQFTHDYIHYPSDENKSSYEVYSYIDEDV